MSKRGPKRFAKTLYMHTLDGQPAQYVPGSQVTFAPRTVNRFATSLAQIRREQQQSEDWRTRHGMSAGGFVHGHRCLRVNVQDFVTESEKANDL